MIASTTSFMLLAAVSKLYVLETPSLPFRVKLMVPVSPNCSPRVSLYSAISEVLMRVTPDIRLLTLITWVPLRASEVAVAVSTELLLLSTFLPVKVEGSFRSAIALRKDSSLRLVSR